MSKVNPLLAAIRAQQAKKESENGPQPETGSDSNDARHVGSQADGASGGSGVSGVGREQSVDNSPGLDQRPRPAATGLLARASLARAGVKAQPAPVSSGASARSESQGTPTILEGEIVSPTSVAKPAQNRLLAAAIAGQEKRDVVQKDYSYLFAEEPKDFQELLNRFDAVLARDSGIDDFNIDLCRNYVRRIYTDLQNQPELDGLLIDRDVANVIHFIRATKAKAMEVGLEKQTKSENKKAKAKPKNRFGDAVLNLDFNGVAKTLEDLSDFGDM